MQVLTDIVYTGVYCRSASVYILVCTAGVRQCIYWCVLQECVSVYTGVYCRSASVYILVCTAGVRQCIYWCVLQECVSV